MEKKLSINLNFWLMLGFFLLALWLVSPFFKIDASDYTNAKRNVYRLFLGLFILIIELGIMAFETFSPQGLAQKVSNVQSIAVFLFGLLLLAFIIFVVAQSAVVYLRTGLSEVDSVF